MKILVPVDGSQYSMEGVEVALDFVKAKSADITLIHVAPFVSGVDLELSARGRAGVVDNLNRTSEQIIKKSGEILKAAGVSFKTILATAPSIAEEIIKVAETDNIDLVIIGSRGLTGAARFLLGSTASRVVRHCPCSVYVVKTPVS